MGTDKFSVGGSPVMDWHPIQRGVETLLVASCHRNRDKPSLMYHLAHMQTLPTLFFFRYFLRVSVIRRISDISKELDLAVHTLSSFPEMNNRYCLLPC